MKPYTEMIAGARVESARWLQQHYGEELPDFGNHNTLTFMDSRGIKAVLIYNGFLWPNIQIHIVTRRGALWCHPELLYHVFAYPLEQLNCSRVTAPVNSKNFASRQAVEALGFKLEGTLRKAARDGSDTLVYGMLKEECRWLNVPERKAA